MEKVTSIILNIKNMMQRLHDSMLTLLMVLDTTKKLQKIWASTKPKVKNIPRKRAQWTSEFLNRKII